MNDQYIPPADYASALVEIGTLRAQLASDSSFCFVS